MLNVLHTTSDMCLGWALCCVCVSTVQLFCNNDCEPAAATRNIILCRTGDTEREIFIFIFFQAGVPSHMRKKKEQNTV